MANEGTENWLFQTKKGLKIDLEIRSDQKSKRIKTGSKRALDGDFNARSNKLWHFFQASERFLTIEQEEL